MSQVRFANILKHAVVVPVPSPQPKDKLGAAMIASQKAKIDDIWASMNAREAPLPGGASGSGLKVGKGRGKTKKKKANKKANKVIGVGIV